MNQKIIGILFATLFLAACGAANKAEETAGDLRQIFSDLSTLIKELKSLDYPEIWVQIQRVEAKDANGNKHIIYDNPNGKTMNLVSQSSAAELLNAKKLPAGSYTEFSITLNKQVTLVDFQGNSTTPTIPNAAGDWVTLTVAADITLTGNTATSLLVDFDPASFVANNNLIDPVIRIFTDAAQQVSRLYANLEGEVTAVNQDNSFILKPDAGDSRIRVNLHGQGVVLDELTLTSSTAFSDILAKDDDVHVLGNYNADRLEIVAMLVSKVKDPVSEGNTSQVDNATVEVEGQINSIDVNADTLVLDIKEASFLPDTNTITVSHYKNATYSHGSSTMLAVGSEIEVKGTWKNDTDTLLASYIALEGAPSSGGDGFIAEVKGTVQSFDGTNLTVTLDEEPDHINLNKGDTLVTDIASAWFKAGNSNCLVAGVEVELKGTVDPSDNTKLVTTLVEVEDGSCATLPTDDNGDDNDGEDGDLNAVDSSDESHSASKDHDD